MRGYLKTQKPTITVGGILSGGCWSVEGQIEAHNKKQANKQHKTTKTHRNSFGERVQESHYKICSRVTNDMEILVCNWFKGTISLAPCVLHKALPVQIN